MERAVHAPEEPINVSFESRMRGDDVQPEGAAALSTGCGDLLTV